jgi:hypothetical protein
VGFSLSAEPRAAHRGRDLPEFMKLLPYFLPACLTASFFLGGCLLKTSVASTLAATVGDLQVHAVVDGPAFIRTEENTAIVTTSAHKVAVDAEGVLLDGQEIARLPAGASEVEVHIARGQLSVTTNGATLVTKPLGQ